MGSGEARQGGRSAPVIVAAVIAAVAGAAFAALAVAVAVRWGPLLAADRAIADAADEYAAAHPHWVRALLVWTTVAGPAVWRVLVVLVGVLLVVRGARRPGAFALASIVGAGVLSTAVKVAIGRARPELAHPHASATGMAFPSGHATTSTVGCGVLVLLAARVLRGAWRAIAWVFAVVVPLSVGYTRVGLGVHWTSDVAGGFLVGVAVVAACHAWIMAGTRAASPEGRYSPAARRPGRPS